MKIEALPIATLTLLASLALAAPARAAIQIPIANSGFESPAVASDGAFGAAPTAWPAFDGGDIKVMNPSSVSDLTAEAPEGTNIGLIESTAVENGLSQTLTSLFQADANYSLTVKVANTRFTTGFPGYRVQLVANGTVLAEDDNTQVVAEDAVITSTVNYFYNVGLHAALVGQPLQIRLLSKGLAVGEELAFDDVRLAVTLANPVANAGGPYTVAIPSGSLTLDASGSLPSDGSSLSLYEWDLNNNGTYDLTGVTPASILYADLTTIHGMIEGPNTVKLRVTDATTAAKATATTTVTLALPSTTFSGTTNTDWNTASNWNAGLPTGTINVAIAAEKAANNASATPATSSGKLTLNAGSKITVPQNTAAGENAVVTTPSSIEFNGGTLDLSSQEAISFPAITLPGTGKLTASNNNGDSRTRNLNNSISGSGQFTIEGRNRQVWNIGFNNSTFSGDLMLAAIDRYEVKFNAAGSAGTGNVTVTPRTADARSAILVLGANNVFADTATLTLNGKGWAGSTGGTYPSSNAAIDMKTFSDTVNKLFILGVQMPAGTYTAGAGTWIIGSGTLTVITGPGDTTAPSLVGSDIVDNKSGGPITAFEKVTYTLTFSEPMKVASIGTDDFENAVSPAATIQSVAPTADPAVFTVTVVPGGTGTLRLQVKAGAVIEDISGNPLVTTAAIPDDTTLIVDPDPSPLLVSIVDNKAGGPIFANETFTCLVTFDQPINPSTVDGADFENGAGPAITVTNVISTGNPAVFAVDVNPGGTGTLTLQIKAGAVITNANGTALNTAAALPDDTTLTVNAGSVPARGTITVSGSASWVGASGTFNPGGSSKLVVIVTGENGNPGDLTGNSSAVTYDGVALTKVVDRNPIGGNPFDQTFNDMWYLDNPATSTGAVMATVNARCCITAFALSGTAAGVGSTAISPQNSKSVVLPTGFANSIVIASHGMGGDGNSANVSAVDAVLPLIETSATAQAGGAPSPWDGHVTGYALVSTAGTAVYSFTGGNLTGSHTVAAEFIAAEPAEPAGFSTWASSFAGLTDTSPSLDFDHGGLATGIEWVVGGDPTLGSDDATNTPTFNNSDPLKFVFSFKRRDLAAADAKTGISVQYSTNLASESWATAIHGTNGVTIDDSAVPEAGFHTVVVSVPKVLAPSGALFARLKVVITP